MVGFDPSSNGKDYQRSSSRGIMARLGEVLVKPVASSSSDSDTDSPGPGPAPAAVKSGMIAIVASSVKGESGSEVGCGMGRREGPWIVTACVFAAAHCTTFRSSLKCSMEDGQQI